MVKTHRTPKLAVFCNEMWHNCAVTLLVSVFTSLWLSVIQQSALRLSQRFRWKLMGFFSTGKWQRKFCISAIQYLTIQLRISSVTVEPEVISTAWLIVWLDCQIFPIYFLLLFCICFYIVIQYFPKWIIHLRHEPFDGRVASRGQGGLFWVWVH